ncbi:MAG: type II secretion system F family protein [Alphaproteobacteria bacterium]|nr:type II secretion system F family protein [Alphaproteobacteria bacterium]
MALFRYRTLQPSGSVAEGEIEASDQQTAVARLQAGGSYPIAVEPADNTVRDSTPTLTGAKLSSPELALLTRELAILLGAGLALDRALAVLRGLKGSPRVAAVAAELERALLAGDSLSAACARHRAFPRSYAPMVAAGEARGDLAEALARIAAMLERAHAVQQSIVSSLVYPASVMAVALLSALLLLGFVVPRFEALLRDLNRELPRGTQVLIALSGFISSWGPWLLLLLVAGAIAFVIRLRDPGFRRTVDARLLRLPLIGPLILKIEAERFARLFGSLIEGGVEIPKALAIAAAAASNRATAAGLMGAEARVLRGDTISTALAASDALPELLVELVRVGDATNRLPEVLVRAADILKQEIDATLTRTIALLTPASTILLGLLVGALMLGVFNAILEVYDVGV